jgi:threonine dehydratase
MAFYTLPSLQDVDDASRLIADKIIETPVIKSSALSQIATSGLRDAGLNGAEKVTIELFLKCENFQRTGSFKFRGAIHFLATLQDSELEKGVVAYSTGELARKSIYTPQNWFDAGVGNHAQSVAHAAQLASRERGIPIPAYVIVPENCPRKKVEAAKHYGANVFMSGLQPEDRVQLAAQVQRATGAILVPPADHKNIVLGQATLVREFLQQVKRQGHELDAIIVPSGGAGLLVGAAAACKNKRVAVFGAEPKYGGPRLADARARSVRIRKLDQTFTVADGLRSLTGEANWEIVKEREHVENVYTVTEQEIRDSLRLAIEDLGFIIEPSAAVPLAVALFNEKFRTRIVREQRCVRVGIVLTGGNISKEELFRIVPELPFDR